VRRTVRFPAAAVAAELPPGADEPIRPGGHLAVSAGVLRTGGVLTPLAWDLAHHLTGRLTFRQIVDSYWDDPPGWLAPGHCLVVQRSA
jgi:hypothetical protein